MVLSSSSATYAYSPVRMERQVARAGAGLDLRLGCCERELAGGRACRCRSSRCRGRRPGRIAGRILHHLVRVRCRPCVLDQVGLLPEAPVRLRPGGRRCHRIRSSHSAGSCHWQPSARWHGRGTPLGWRFRTAAVADPRRSPSPPPCVLLVHGVQEAARPGSRRTGPGIPAIVPVLVICPSASYVAIPMPSAVRAEVQRAAGLAACSLAAGSRGVRALAYPAPRGLRPGGSGREQR